MEAECKTLWMGDIQMNWDEAFIAEQPVIKMIRDKVTGYPSGYGFLEFPTQQGAQAVLEAYNGQLIPNTLHRFRLNWGAGGRRIDSGEDYAVFVGDLAPDVTDDLLFSTFSTRFANVRNAKVVIDPITRMSKGFGFVRFANKEEADQALQTMNGVYCSSRAMRVSVATDRTTSRARQGNPMQPTQLPTPGAGYGTAGAPVGVASGSSGQLEDDPTGANTTVFIGGLDATINDEELRARFVPFGDIVSVKVPPGKGCGFVQYVHRDSAETAINQMNGSVINGVKIRCAWGRAAAARAQAAAAAAAASASGGYYPPYHQQAYMNYYGGYGTPGGGSYYQQMYQHPQGYGYGGASGYGGGYQSGPNASYYAGASAAGGAGGAPTHQHQHQEQQQQQQQHLQHQHQNLNGAGNSSYGSRPTSGGEDLRQLQQITRDFTKADDVQAMNRRYAAQRGYQHVQPNASASYQSMNNDVTNNTAMATSS